MGPVLLETVGPCPRCEMLSVDQRTGIRTPKPEILLELASYRRRRGKMMFGTLLAASASKGRLGTLLASASASASKGHNKSNGGEIFPQLIDDALAQCSEHDWLTSVFGSQSVLKVGHTVIARSR